ncbi:uncharacterized protein [Nicotiana sylvestris]|uniref:Uncharacterized protein LOC104243644 n=1 Tax=Nicotiana sylvestris TaxID=4096 RepID=A0A1U7YD47_NICSY|nr:PREDICTED: uncharacterized protein LOC104243644 [Nicotiana sylvestris]
MSHDELRGNLIAFEKTHLDRQIQQENKKIVAFKATVAEPENEEEEEGGEQDENIAMLSQVITSMMRKNRNSRRGTQIDTLLFDIYNETSDSSLVDELSKCYECGKHGHIQAECPELKKKLSRNFEKKKSFGAWSDEEKSDHKDIANMCFVAIKKDNNEDSGELGLMVDEGKDEEEDSGELGLMADEGTSKKNQKGKKDFALKLEVCEIERDMLQDEVNKLQLQLNGLRKSSSHSSVKSNQSLHTSLIRTRNSTVCFYSKNGHNTNQCKNRIREERVFENPNNPSHFYCRKLGHTSNRCMFKDNRRWEHRKKNRKGKWYLDSACSIHMIGDKQLFKTVTKLDGEIVTFGDKSKGNVIGVGKVPLSSTCDVDEVYLVDELGYNLLSIS